AGKLQPIKGQGQGRSEALPPAIRTEAAGLRADRGADPVRLGGTVLESQQDGVAEGVDLLGGDAELEGELHLAVASGGGEGEREGVVGGREDVGAGAGGGEFVDFE